MSTEHLHSSAPDTVRIVINCPFDNTNRFEDLPVLRRDGVLVIHRPHEHDGGGHLVAVTHAPSGLRIGPAMALSTAQKVVDALRPFPMADLVVTFGGNGQPRIANRRRCPWLKEAKAAVDAVIEAAHG